MMIQIYLKLSSMCEQGYIMNKKKSNNEWLKSLDFYQKI